MIDRYRNFLNEGYYDYDPMGYSEPDFEKTREIENRVSRFKDFISKLKGEDKSVSSGSEVDDEEEDDSVSKDYQGKATSFSNVDEMIDLVVNYLKKHGITNPLVQRAILSTIGKESGFTATKEVSYKTTSPERIREIFGSRFSDLTDEEINELKKNDDAFWEKVYGGDWGKKYLGNTNPGDGAKYVGRGFNGITGRANYQVYTDLLKKSGSNVDLIANPEILEKDPNVSAEVNALYFVNSLTNPIIKKKYGNNDPNDFQSFESALKAVVNANAGAGVDINTGIAKKFYDKALAANSKLGSKFDKALSGEEKIA